MNAYQRFLQQSKTVQTAKEQVTLAKLFEEEAARVANTETEAKEEEDIQFALVLDEDE